MPDPVLHTDTFPEGYCVISTTDSETSMYGLLGGREKVVPLAVKAE